MVYVPPLPATLPELRARIYAAAEQVTPEMLVRVWEEIDYRWDITSNMDMKVNKNINMKEKRWQAFLATQPDQDKNLTSDIAAIEHAMRTMGDYKLKCSDDYKLLDQSKNTTLYKLNQLVEAKREIYNMKEEFNRKVHMLREHKVELVRKMEHLETRLICLHKELPKDSRIHSPPLPQLNVAKEYPERQYQISPGREPGIMSPPLQEFDEEFFILYGSRISLTSLYSFDEDLEEYDKENESLSDEENINQDEDTLWENEIRILRTARQVFKQNDILEEMEVLMTEFDTHLEELSHERLQLSIDIKYLECFVNLLHQELHIIHSYDKTEAAILERVNNSLAEKHTKHLKVNILQHKIDARAAELTQVEEKLAAVEKSFTELTAGNRVSKHLTRIFRKKYRPQLLKRENEEEESEEESSTEEDTSDDSDSAVNVGKPSPRIDDNKCPADCDKEIHKETLELRSKRYQLEAKITSEKQAIDLMVKEKERTFKFLKLIEPVLRMNQDQLEKIQKDKQTKLNETEVLVVLSCSQVCGQNLLMSRDDLDKLRARVSELQRQTDVQLEKLKKSQRYQQRLTDDYSKIDLQISQLKKDIDKAMICKFGQHVDVETLEEKILEQMIQRTRKTLKEEELHKKYERMIKDLKEELLEKTEDLADLMRENTHKLQMLSSLEEEKQKLIALAIRVNKAAAEPNDREAEYTQDVHKLTKILNCLLLQKETIIHEIKVLSLKGRPLPPIVQTVVKEPDTIMGPKCESRDSDDVPTTEEGHMAVAEDLEEKEEDSEFEYMENGATEQ
ncbi:cilium-dependent cell motility [Homalodisca vitripennis]|nr:cilium-dependent cell motility [Homalodisca vitripennis]KAG8329029.1 cilium-dependent cell motility [Homalodisca vitripennis]